MAPIFTTYIYDIRTNTSYKCDKSTNSVINTNLGTFGYKLFN